MKRYKKVLVSLFATATLLSCVDDNKLLFDVKKPISLEEFEYLKEYDVLKSYNSNPNLKIGAGVSVSDFTKKGADYAMIVSNFNEVVAGWEMKHAGVVQNDGSFNFANVTSFIETAQAADIAIYGHTLTWHANQNATYLNKTIAPIRISGGSPGWEVIDSNDFETTPQNPSYDHNEGAEFGFGTGASGTGQSLKVINAQVREQAYQSQLFITFGSPAELGDKYKLTMKVRADAEAEIGTQGQAGKGNWKGSGTFGTINATSAWKDHSWEATVDVGLVGITTIAFDLGKTATSYYFDDIVVSKWTDSGAGEPFLEENLVINSTFETGADGWTGWNPPSSRELTAEGGGANGSGKGYNLIMPTEGNFWEAQAAYDFPQPLQNGSKYVLKLKVKGTAAYNLRAGMQETATYGSDNFLDIPVTTSWTEHELSVHITAADRTRLIFSYGDFVGTITIDDVTLQRENPNEGGEQIIEKTPEEKYDIIYGELERWISGMMEVSKDYVKAWDVVNEPMDDGNPYELKTGIGRAEIAADEFFWQDYLGEDYAVYAFKMAMQYGNPGDKLFINDYNLEYNLDKCRGIIAYVEYIEGEGARVDGIGTQMHIHTGSDRSKIEEMLTLLAETGKLIKISELDIGIEGGVKTQDATSQQLLDQADMYKFVVEKYLEIIPASQQYGITVWSPRDSPTGSSWRGGEPIGLWTEQYNRKHAYGAFADALKQ